MRKEDSKFKASLGNLLRIRLKQTRSDMVLYPTILALEGRGRRIAFSQANKDLV